ncbi:MAG: S8 family serine peptidase [Phycisphaerales bacterium]
MKFHTLIQSVAMVLVTAVTAHGQIPSADPAVPGRAIIRVLPGVSIEAAIAYVEPLIEAHLSCTDVTFTVIDGALASRRLYLLSFEPTTCSDAVEIELDLLKDDLANTTSEWGEILYADHDPESNTGSIWFQTISGFEQYSNQYAETMLGLGPAQTMSTGQGVVVAVLDTGIDATHPLLADAIAPGGYNFINDSPDTSDPVDGVGHGTFVASLIHLTAPDATLLPVVVLDSDGFGDLWLLTRGIYHAIDRGVEVINLSLGSTYNSDAVADAIEDARSLGIVVTAAGGNNNVGPDTQPEYPASRSNILGVAAVNSLGFVKADFSNYDPDFFISAPGSFVEDAGAPEGFDPALSIYGAVPGGGYAIWQGTSFGTAFVSGAAALVRAQHPEWAADESTWVEIETVLEKTAVPIDAKNDKEHAGQLGAGRLDTAAATMLGPIAPTLGDLDNDGTVGIADFLTLLDAWGQVHSSADLDGDGVVGITDFLMLLANWG